MPGYASIPVFLRVAYRATPPAANSATTRALPTVRFEPVVAKDPSSVSTVSPAAAWVQSIVMPIEAASPSSLAMSKVLSPQAALVGMVTGPRGCRRSGVSLFAAAHPCRVACGVLHGGGSRIDDAQRNHCCQLGSSELPGASRTGRSSG